MSITLESLAIRKAALEREFQGAAAAKQQGEQQAQQAAQQLVRLQGAYAELEALEKSIKGESTEDPVTPEEVVPGATSAPSPALRAVKAERPRHRS